MTQSSDSRFAESRTSSSAQWLAEYQHGCTPGFFCLSRDQKTHSRQNPNDLDKVDIKPTEDFLAAKMNKLSIQEMSKALEDVHCVGEELKENKDVTKRSLAEFDAYVKTAQSPIYEIAACQNSAFVENETFRLKFLRAQSYDAKKAAHQMLNFLKHKATYFGEDKLTREIMISDLNDADLRFLRSGVYSIQQDKDRAGRVVLYVLNHLLAGCSVKTMIRVTYFFWYNLLVSLPEVQMKGLACVYYDTAKPGKKFLTLGLKSQMAVMNVAATIPYRYTSVQLCLKAGKGLALNNAVLRVIMSAYPESSTVRTRLHYGSNMELQYQLQSHGIMLKTCPVDSAGETRQDILNVWYEKHLVYMESRGGSVGGLRDTYKVRTTSIVGSRGSIGKENLRVQTVVIGCNDVLLGRGKGSQDHPGNVRFREVLNGHRDVYDKAPRKKRRIIANELALMLRSNGVRFHKLNEGKQWVEETDSKAVEDKIGQLFRSIRKKK